MQEDATSDAANPQELHDVNDLERLTINMRRKWQDWRKRMQFGPKPAELSTEEKKMAELTDIIKTYRHVDEEKEEVLEELPWPDRPSFDIFINSVIGINTVLIGVELDAEYNDGARDWGWIFIEVIFMLIFVYEVRIKIQFHTWKWIFFDKWNVFTTFIASMAFIDCVILQAAGLHGQLRLLSLVRVLGMIRLLRVIRTFKSLKELRLVMQGLVGSMVMLFWTVVVLIVFLYISAVFTTSIIGRSEAFDDVKVFTNGFDHDELFGSVAKSMYTLLQITTRDGWASKIVRYVMIYQWYMCFFFLAFGMVSTYGLLNLVISVIVEQTLTAARANDNKNEAKEAQAKKAELEALKEIFVEIDEDGSGELDAHEFLEALKNPDVLWKMRELELPLDDAAGLFSVIDGEGTRALTMEEFIDGCTKLKGSARSRDLLALTAQADTLSTRMDTLAEELQDTEKMLYDLDEISLSITQRFQPAVKSSKKKIAKAVGGSAPVIPMHPEKLGSAIGVDLASGNRPLLPDLPNLLS